METKLIAAEIATAAGVATVITSSKDPTAIFRIIAYNTAAHTFRAQDAAHALLPLTVLPPSAPETPVVRTPAREITPAHTPLRTGPTPAEPATRLAGQETGPGRAEAELPVRPPHTLFIPSPMPLRDLKSWTTHTLYPAGSVLIDTGAHVVLSRRSSGGRLLPAGVLEVRGAFASGQAVRILVRRKVGGMASAGVKAVGIVDDGDDATVVEVSTTASQDSSGPDSPLLLATVLTGSADNIEESVALSEEPSPPETATTTLPAEELSESLFENQTHVPDDKQDDGGEWEVIEVGRGLANYNSAEITKIMGQKRLVNRLIGS